MQPAGIWERVSTDDQDEANQSADNDAWCDDKGYTVKRRYQIRASAHKGNKKFDEAWQEVLNDFRSGLIKVLVVWRLTRLDRKLAATRMIAEVVALGGRVEFVKQPHLNNLSTMAGRISLKVEEEIAFAESEEKTDRIKASVNRIRVAGSFYGKVPWGYKTTGTRYSMRLVPTDEGRKYIPEIFDRIITGESFETIAAWMQTQTSRKWAKHTVEVIAHNEVYTGHATDVNGKWVHECEALITTTTYQRAQKSIDKRPKRGPSKNDPYLLKGFLFCPDCGGDAPMYRSFSSGKKQEDGTRDMSNIYLRCNGRQATVNGAVIPRKGCGNMIRMEEADKVINAAMSAWQTHIYEITVIPGHNWENELAQVKAEIKQLASEDLTDSEYDAKLAELRAKRDDYMNRESVDDDIKRTDTGITFGARWSKLGEEGKRAFMATEKVKVYLSKKNHLELIRQGSNEAHLPVTVNDDGTPSEDDGTTYGFSGGVFHCISLPDYGALAR